MKKVSCVLTLALLAVSAINLRGQDIDCPDCGWYADGVKVEKIDCYGWKKLEVVLPYQPGMSGYETLLIRVLDPKAVSGSSGIKTVPGNAVQTLVKNDRIVHTVFAGADDNANLYRDYEGNLAGITTEASGITKSRITKTKSERILYVQLYNLSIAGYTEKYDSYKQAYVKTPNYSEQKLSDVYTLSCVKSVNPDPTQPCAFQGKKFGEEGATTAVAPTAQNKEPVAVTKPTNNTNNTPDAVTSAPSALNAASLKPLDKSKPGYFTEKSGGVVLTEGYKKDGVAHGEMRMYDGDGKLEHVYTYANNELNGYAAEYDPETGELLESGNHKAGERDGEWKRYKNGKVIGMDTYVNGEQQ